MSIFTEEQYATTCGFFIPSSFTEKAFLLHKGTIIFTAKVSAIIRAIRHLSSLNSVKPGQEIFILVDLLAAIGVIASPTADREELVLFTIDAIRGLKLVGCKVTLVWIPRQIGVNGNEKEDALAVAACVTHSNSVADSFLSVAEAVFLFKKSWINECREFLYC